MGVVDQERRGLHEDGDERDGSFPGRDAGEACEPPNEDDRCGGIDEVLGDEDSGAHVQF